MSFVNAMETALLQHLFQNAAIANVGDASGLPASTGAGSSQLQLHTAAQDDTQADLTANAVTYTGYARPTQARSAAGWTVTNNVADNAALIQFGEMSAGGPVTAVYVSLGLLATGDVVRMNADLNSDLVINNGVNPQFAIGSLDWTLD